MKASYLMVGAECINPTRDSVYRITLLPYVDGIEDEGTFFDLNPEAPFEWAASGVSEEQILSFPKFHEKWAEIEALFDRYAVIVANADGYAAEALYRTLSRLGIDFTRRKFFTAKSILRKALPKSISYNHDFLLSQLLPFMKGMDPSVETWGALVAEALETSEDATLEEFAEKNGVTPGLLAPGEFVRVCAKRVRDYSPLDFSDVDIHAVKSNPFYGANVVFTGKLVAMLRDDARRMVVAVGGQAPENLTSKTDFLVVGTQDLRVVGEKGLSGKMKKAAAMKEKGSSIEVIDEHDFLEMISIHE